MGKITNKLIANIEEHVFGLLNNSLPQGCHFHTQKHTVEVLKDTVAIAKYLKVSEDEINLLRIGALFHDLGYINAYQGHEHKSAEFARDYLTLEQLDTTSINFVIEVILSTQVPQKPKNKFEMILCDADLAHLTYENYFENMERLRLEWIDMGIVSFSEKEFHENSVKFFASHDYHTEYGRVVLNPLKNVNLNRIKNRIESLQ